MEKFYFFVLENISRISCKTTFYLLVVNWINFIILFPSRHYDKKLNILFAQIFEACTAVADFAKVSRSDGLYIKLGSQLQVYLNLTRIHGLHRERKMDGRASPRLDFPSSPAGVAAEGAVPLHTQC